MQILPICPTNFKAGNIKLNNINAENLYSFKAIKKLADDYKLDIFIIKNKTNEYLPFNDCYLAFVKNENNKRGISCNITKRYMNKTESSVNVFNTVLSAIENLNNKLQKKSVR